MVSRIFTPVAERLAPAAMSSREAGHSSRLTSRLTWDIKGLHHHVLGGDRKRMTLEQRVIHAIARACHVAPSEITPSSTFEELGVDSLTGLQIVFELEEEFQISIPENVAASMRSVQDVIDRLGEVVGVANA
ncbi:MAG TPA: phosphopantetheine-binding protein [Blastocatellia bacterium]|nr:phosphopantetheine-binding protein [Blastocatellia bacterium]